MWFLWFNDESFSSRCRRGECKKFCRWRGRFPRSCIVRWYEVTIQVGESSRLHRFATTAATSWDERGVDGIVGFVKPFIFSLATVAKNQYSDCNIRGPVDLL